MADHFANRLITETRQSSADTIEDDQIRRAYQLLCSRLPDEKERVLCRQFVARRGLREFCRAMWSSSEFVFVD